MSCHQCGYQLNDVSLPLKSQTTDHKEYATAHSIFINILDDKSCTGILRERRVDYVYKDK